MTQFAKACADGRLLLLPLTLFVLTASAQKPTQARDFEIRPDETEQYEWSGNKKFSVEKGVPVQISGINDAVLGKTADEKAFNWIVNNANLMKLRLNQGGDLKMDFSRNGPSGSVFRFQQYLDDIRVYQSQIVVKVAQNEKVTSVSSSYNPLLAPINTRPTISAQQAQTIAKNHIGLVGNAFYEKVELVVYHHAGNTRLAYQTITEADDPTGSWEVLVDATTGQIFKAVDNAVYHSHESHENRPNGDCLPAFWSVALPATAATGSGFVFDPDPLSKTGNAYAGAYVDNGDVTNSSLNNARSSVTLLGIEEAAGTYKLKGTYAEIVDSEAPNRGLFTQATSTFNFTRQDDGFEAVNVYYHVDKSMRYINDTLGISVMPFQYSGGVRFDPHGLGGADNSHYLGGSGQIAFGEGGVDDAEDADVIIHELGHGLHDWITGGSLSQVNGLSEGSGDYWAQSYCRSLGQWNTMDAAYHWVFNWDGHNEFWPGRVTNYAATYPGGLVGQVHADGQMWASTLMQIFDVIGREKTDKAFLEGLAMTGSSSNQQDAAIAVRQAAIDMKYSCQDIAVFTQIFTQRGYTMPALNGPPTLSVQPLPVVVCSGSDARFFITASNAIDYQWQVNTGSGFEDIVDNAVYFGSNNDTLKLTAPTAGFDGYVYRCVAKGVSCPNGTSNGVSLTFSNPVCDIMGPSTVCAGVTGYSYSGPTGLSSYAWSVTGNGMIDGAANAQSVMVDAGAAGNFMISLLVTDADGCTKDCSFPVVVNAQDDASFNYSSGSFCQNEADPNPIINGLAGGTFTAMPVGLSISSSTGIIDLSASTPGAYAVTYTTNGPCPNSQNQAVTVDQLIPLVDAGADQQICSTSTVLAANNPTVGTGLWSIVSGTGGVIANPSNYNSGFSGLEGTSYTLSWTITNGACSPSDQVNIILQDLVLDVPEISGPLTICPNLNSIPYSVSPQPGVTDYQWSYSGTGVVISNNGSPNVSIDFSESATAGQLSVELINPCEGGNATGNLDIQLGDIQTCSFVNCLLSNLLVTDDTLVLPGSPHIFKVSDQISSNATLPSPKTFLFKAGNSVDLLPGFGVNGGAVFAAEIEDCPVIFPFQSKVK
ncbi:MAG: M36 family metallopeptidase [Saprospiraceae bacterium]|nr:M36 family metallopeptidase [Saprospiraceae bacterium]